MRVAILANTNISYISRKMSAFHEIYMSPGYNAWAQDILDNNSSLASYGPQAIVILLDGQEITANCRDLDSGIKELELTLLIVNKAIEKYSDIPVFVGNIDIPQKRLLAAKDIRPERVWEDFWREKTSDIIKANSNMVPVDLKSIIEQHGRETIYSEKLWYLAGEKYSPAGSGLIADNINQLIWAWLGNRKKCLVLDLDNTLWGGVLGEDSLAGIELSENKEGARYRDFQKRIKEIKDLGIMLAVVSKNDRLDALEAINTHPHMVLREADFVSLKINWESKVDNILALSRELNVGLDSFVFIDDNPVERAAVESSLPEVTILPFPKDSVKLEAMIIDGFRDNFLPITTTDEDKEKTSMYRNEIHRAAAKEKAGSLEEFLCFLEMKVTLWKAGKKDVERISQLTQKTNQFNVTTRRYTINDINSRIGSSDWRTYVASLTDRYGDSGVISVLILEIRGKRAVIDTFLLSCRVMGRHIEDAIIGSIEKKVRNEGLEEISAAYIPTRKNVPVSDLYERLGYDLVKIGEDNRKDYVLKIKEAIPERKIFADVNWLGES